MSELPQNLPIDDLASQSDQALLRLFVGEQSEEAFRAIVERYGPLVLSVCRRGAPCASDADDAFQATFLVLARSARKVRKQKSLGSWLYGVATRVSARLRREKARRNTVQLFDAMANEAATNVLSENHDPLDELLARHDEAIVDRELAKLPESLRAPLVLRYLAGKSNATVAQELGISIAALEGRLKRAKQRLRVRLIRQGITLFSTVAILKTTRVALGQLPPELLTQTVTTCFDPTSIAVSTTTPDAISPTHLALEELRTMNALLISKPIAAVLSVSAIATLVLGTQLALSQAPTQAPTNGQASAISLDVTVDSEDSGEATGAISVAPAADDPFAEAPNEEPKPPAQQPIGGYGYGGMEGGRMEGGGYGGMEGGYGMEGPAGGIPTKDAEPTWDPTAPFDLKPRSPAEQRIAKALAGPLTERLDCKDTALEEVVMYLQEVYEIQILLDQHAIDDVGISPNEPVTISVRDVTVRSALRLILGRLDLTYVVRSEVLMITTPEAAENELETRVYPVGHLELDEEELQGAIVATIATSSWAENGGGSAEIRPIGGNLVISQTLAVHEEISNLFWQLTQAQDQSGN